MTTPELFIASEPKNGWEEDGHPKCDDCGAAYWTYIVDSALWSFAGASGWLCALCFSERVLLSIGKAAWQARVDAVKVAALGVVQDIIRRHFACASGDCAHWVDIRSALGKIEKQKP